MDHPSTQRLVSGETMTYILSPRALWRMTGPDSERYLNGQVPNDMTKLRSGTGCYAAVCTAKGRMEGDVSIARHDDAFFLDASLELREGLGARLDKYLIADDAALEDISDDWSLSHVFGEAKPVVPAAGFAIAYARYGVPGHDVWIAGSDAFVAGERIKADVVETLRIENMIPRWGAELTAQTLPPEAGPHMLASISYTKGCYVGQETIARLKSVGHVNRTLVFLESDSEKFPAAGAKLRQGEKEIGSITSSTYSSRLQRGVALGYAPRLPALNDTPLEAEGVRMTIKSSRTAT